MVWLVNVRRFGQVFEVHQTLFQPQLVRAFGGSLLFDLFIGDDPAKRGIHQEHPAWLKTALLQDALGWNIEHTDFRGHDDPVVLRHIITRGTQPVAVEHRADLQAVGERNRGRAVPWLDQAPVVLVKRLFLLAHALMSRPRLGNHHHHRVRQRAAAQHEELEAIVEHGRVAAILVDNGQQLLDVVAEQVGLQQRFASVHPADVAAQRVDLTVVRDIAVRVRALPARERVGAKARVHQRQRGFDCRIAQIGKERGDLLRREHSLVNDRFVGEARNVKPVAALDAGVADAPFRQLADHVQLALERHVVFDLRISRYKYLANNWFGSASCLAERAVGRGDGAPTEQPTPFVLDNLFKEFLALVPFGCIRRQVDHANAVLAVGGQRDLFLRAHLFEKLVRDLHQNPGAIARVRLAATRPAVAQIHKDRESLTDDLVRFAALYVDDEADAAGLMFEPRVVQALFLRPTIR